MSSNPYQTPEGQLTTEDLAYGEIKFFSPSSRINRLRYWAHSMLFTLVAFALLAIVGLVAAFLSSGLALGLGAIVYIGMIVFSFILVIQRLHDLNKSGWMSLLMIIPLANIYLLVLLIFFKGTEGRNNYGLQTPPNKTWHWILAFMYPALVIVAGILAAVALPAYQNYVQRAQDINSQFEQEFDYPADDSASEGVTDESGYPTEDADATDEQVYESVDEVTEEVTDEVPSDSVYESEAESAEDTETPQ